FVVIRIPFSGSESRHRVRSELPRNPVGPPAGDPAVLVHRAIAKNLEVLLCMSRRRFGVVEGKYKTHALHGRLRDTIDFLRLRKARDLEDSGCDVNDVRELAADAAFVLDAFGPGADHGGPDAGKVGRES